MRPLGQYPPIGLGTPVTPITFFTPKHQGAGTTHNAENFNAAYQHIGNWKGRYKDALEIRNWRLRGVMSTSGMPPDGFSYDPLRRWYFAGGTQGLSTSGFLYYSPDGTRWTRAGTSTLPTTSGGGDDGNVYSQACSDDGRYFTWRTTVIGVVVTTHAFLNSNAGPDNWTESANKPVVQLTHAYFAPSDNRFVVCGLNDSTHVSEVWSVDVDSDTWDPMPLSGATIQALTFGAGNIGNRLVATSSKLWRTSSVASDFQPVTIPWTALLALVYLPGSFVFLAVTAAAIYSSPNGVVWSRVATGYEGKGSFVGPAAGLGDACAVSFVYAAPDGVGAQVLLIGTNNLRNWVDVPAPFVTTRMILARDRLAVLDDSSQGTFPLLAESMRINP